MNRKQRRALGIKDKGGAKPKRDFRWQLKQELIEKVETKVRQTIDDWQVRALYLCFALCLHDQLGFGQKRIMRMMQAVDAKMEIWRREDLEGEEALKILDDELMAKANMHIFVGDVGEEKK